MTRLIVADARRVSPCEFLDFVFGTSPEDRAKRDRAMEPDCIAAIERGDTYGWPPLMVARCREIIDARLTETKGDPMLAKNRRAA